jgi:hypothetical protein
VKGQHSQWAHRPNSARAPWSHRHQQQSPSHPCSAVAPCSQHPPPARAIQVSVLPMPADSTPEQRLTHPATLLDVPTLGAPPTRIPRIHHQYGHTRYLCLIINECPQLVERPLAMPPPLPTPNRTPRAYTPQIL